MKSNILAQGPKINSIERVVLPILNQHSLKNGIQVYELKGGSQDVIKIEVLFLAGRPYEQKELAAKICSSLLKEGTSSKSSNDIAQLVDKYGATLTTSSGMDSIQLTLYSLTKKLEHVLPMVSEIINDAIFPEEEFAKLKIKSIEQLSLDLEKNDVVAYRELTKHIFGDNHAYGYNSSIDSYKNITLEDIKKHYSDSLVSSRCHVFISGNFSDQDSSLIQKELENITPKEPIYFPSFEKNLEIPCKIHIPAKNNVQTAIRFGRKLFPRKHPDYANLFFLSTVLGGYFGSRLMSNIREDKGYTYGIYSTMDNMIHDGYFMIGTEVANRNVENTIVEIRKEVELLKTNLIKPDEMKIVKNYLLGNFLQMMDGPFSSARLAKTFVLSGLAFSDLLVLFDKIKNVEAPEILETANNYLDLDKMWNITVG